MLNAAFPSRFYKRDVIQRLHDTQRRKLWSDDHLIKFRALGQVIKDEGGIFEIEIDDDLTISSIHIQTKKMREYFLQIKDIEARKENLCRTFTR